MTSRGLTGRECQALFNRWRSLVMGNRSTRQSLPEAVAGYFFHLGTDLVIEATPLGRVRRDLLDLIGRTDLTDEQRSVVELYYGLHGLPLPFSSSSEPDIAGGRHESSARATGKTALAKIGRQADRRPMAEAPTRPVIDPLLEPWFRGRTRNRAERVRVTARAYVRAVANCDGPHAKPTIAALDQWYRRCGHADPDLVRPTGNAGPRPNTNALARASALMEIALYEEVGRAPLPVGRPAAAVPTPASPHPDGLGRLAETVTHPALAALLNDISPEALLRAADALKERSLDGDDVAGQSALLLRCARPRLHQFRPRELERLAAAISYLAITPGNPFLSLEWLGHFLGHVGVTDRTFTVLVNTSEAASIGGYHQLSHRVDRLSQQLRADWEIPADQLPLVEHAEVEQQRLMASGFRNEHIGLAERAAGNPRRAARAFVNSIRLATESATLAHRILTDTRTFPDREIEGKARHHGGDLLWSWALAAAIRVVEPALALQSVAADAGIRESEAEKLIRCGVRVADRIVSDCDEPLDHPRFERWGHDIREATARLVGT